mmetsp:Transcript_24211/g.63776  ORF Transcript_24211/g.63776 Transcript_24211/m.63776 type:complete len:233 (-) Transcript_24211:395-1093(-)
MGMQMGMPSMCGMAGGSMPMMGFQMMPACMGMMGGMGGMMPMAAMGNRMQAMMMATQQQDSSCTSWGNPMQAMMMAAQQQEQQQQMQQLQRQQQQKEHSRAMAVIKAGAISSAADDDSIGAGGAPSVSRTNINHPAYRPPNTEPVPGVTDKRWEGYIRLFIEDHLHGYGFIKCEELRKKFPDKDVFLHRNQRNGFNQGDTVNFGVFMNFRGMPQATDLRKPRPKTEQGNDDD